MTHSYPAATGITFEILSEIAVGATSRIDLCRMTSPASGQLIAVKRLLPEIASDPSVSARFLDEVWTTSSLRHPNVVGVIGWGDDALGAYLAVELVQGVSLARLLKTVVDTREEFPERLVVHVGALVARGLSAAHERRSEHGESRPIVHRDLSASNVLVSFQGEVKITDFGLSRAKDGLVQTSSALPARAVGHLAPEDLRGEPIDTRADLYGVGVMLFELLLGKPPFSGQDDVDTVRHILQRPVPDPLLGRPKMDKLLAQLIRQCLEKDPNKRPQSANEIRERLESWLASHGYRDDNTEALARFVRRNAMKQMRWFERVISGPDEGEAANAHVLARDATPYPPRPIADLPPMPPSSRIAQRAHPNEDGRGTIPIAADSSSHRDSEPTVVESAKKVQLPLKKQKGSDAPPTLPKRRRDAMNALPRVNESDYEEEEEENENIPTIAIRRKDVMRALIENAVNLPNGAAAAERARAAAEARKASDARATSTGAEFTATQHPAPAAKLPQAPSATGAPSPPARLPSATADFSEADSMIELIDMITEDPSGDGAVPTDVLRRDVAVDALAKFGRSSSESIDWTRSERGPSTLAQKPVGSATPFGAPATPFGAPHPPPPPPIPRKTTPPPPPPPRAPRPPHQSVESMTMTMTNQVLAPEYITHQIERLSSNAAKKAVEARAAREEADEAAREAEAAEDESRKAERAVAAAVEALNFAQAKDVSRAAEKLEEALSLVDGPLARKSFD